MALIGQAVSEKKMFEHCGRRTDGRRTTDHGYTISSPCEPNGSGELKNTCSLTSYFFFYLNTYVFEICENSQPKSIEGVDFGI